MSLPIAHNTAVDFCRTDEILWADVSDGPVLTIYCGEAWMKIQCDARMPETAHRGI